MFSSLILGLLLSLASGAMAADSCRQILLPTDHLLTRTVERSLFVKSRDLWDYHHELDKDFQGSLKRLRSDQHWIDLGAGRALAEYDYIKSFRDKKQAAFVTAVAFKINRWFPLRSFGGKLEAKEGLFELMDTSTWRKADLITDLYGVTSYTKDLRTSLQKTLNLLNVQGELYITSVQYETSIRVNEQFLGLREFLMSIPGLRVEGKWGAIKVTKLQEQVLIPELELLDFREQSPPSRRYKVVP